MLILKRKHRLQHLFLQLGMQWVFPKWSRFIETTAPQQIPIPVPHIFHSCPHLLTRPGIWYDTRKAAASFSNRF